MFLKRIQLGLIHVAVAVTLVPINSTLNRVMIKELAISATLVALLASLPYLFSPLQMFIGSFSDRNPLWGWRRTPYIIFGLLLCVLGVALAPLAAFTIPENFGLGLFLAALVFGAWGMGFNFASVSYLSLASELSGEEGRSRTVSIMWFMMISGIIATAITLSQMLETYTPQLLETAFLGVALGALVLGTIGLIGLEPRSRAASTALASDRHSWLEYIRVLVANPQSRLFFIYLTLMLSAILGQDILLEPFGAEAFDMPVNVTTRITSIWGVCVLVALVIAGLLEGRIPKRRVAVAGSLSAILAFGLIILSGMLVSTAVFYSGVVLLGISTGLATVSNLSLMLDMTSPGKVGLFIGAWGMANAAARGLGALVSGAVRDTVAALTQGGIEGYLVVFFLYALMLAASLLVLQRVDLTHFQHTKDHALPQMGVVEKLALSND